MATEEQYTAVRNQWDAMSAFFHDNLQSNTLALANQLASLSKAYTADSVLELGAGCGGSAAARALLMRPGAKHVVSDIAEKMVAYCKELAEDMPEGRKFEARVLNAEDTGLDSDSFDTIIANLVLHLTPSADTLLKEGVRLLKKGGRFAASFWGDESKSPMFTLVPDSIKEMGINMAERGFCPPYNRYAFGSDLEAVKRRCIEAGFSKVFTYGCPMNLDYVTGEDFAEAQFNQPQVKKVLTFLSEEEAEKLKPIVIRKANELLSTGTLISSYATMLLAVK
uniref:Methyltransferase type 11 domain-containing protein n=1 Tax=Palpitomonas bilix TaxID=652834 RepID=A0A7S3LWH6_9EUKA